jgi:hypothetical protein
MERRSAQCATSKHGFAALMCLGDGFTVEEVGLSIGDVSKVSARSPLAAPRYRPVETVVVPSQTGD